MKRKIRAHRISVMRDSRNACFAGLYAVGSLLGVLSASTSTAATSPAVSPADVVSSLEGTLATPEIVGACEKINFDPLVMADGIQPTNDPVLLFRSPAYAISYGKRLSNH